MVRKKLGHDQVCATDGYYSYCYFKYWLHIAKAWMIPINQCIFYPTVYAKAWMIPINQCVFLSYFIHGLGNRISPSGSLSLMCCSPELDDEFKRLFSFTELFVAGWCRTSGGSSLCVDLYRALGARRSLYMQQFPIVIYIAPDSKKTRWHYTSYIVSITRQITKSRSKLNW